MTQRLISTPPPSRLADAIPRSRRFEVCAELGRGASGVVYDVFDRERQERVALKLLFHDDHAQRFNLEGELSLSRAVDHPNLVRVYETGVVEGAPYLLMERVIGTSLSRYVGGPERLDEARLRSCLIQLLSVLDALHARHHVHRDVKPDNLTVTNEGRLVLLDFGITASREDLVWAEPSIGTPAYMAPEQVTGGPIGPSADLYAVGAILYELLTGCLPHPEALEGLVMAKLTVDPAPPSHRARTISADLDQLCCDLLRRDPEDRPQAARVLRRLGAPREALTKRILVRHAKGAVGRELELTRLDRMWTRARTEGAWLHVQGPQGRGKRTLIEAFIRRIREVESGNVILRGRCASVAHVPYAGIDGVMLDLGEAITRAKLEGSELRHAGSIAWLAQMFPAFFALRAFRTVRPESAPVHDPIQRRLRAAALLGEVVTQLAVRGPVLVCLEDVDRSHSDARNVLESAFANRKGVFILTSGSEALWPSASEAKPECLSLETLSGDAAKRVLDEIWNDAVGSPPDNVEDLVAAAQGEPWALTELARARLGGLRCETAGEALTRSVESLSEHALRMLHCLSLFDRVVPQGEWLDGVELDPRTFHRALFELVQQGLVEGGEGVLEPRYRIAHAFVRHALSASARSALAVALARAHAPHSVLEEEDRAQLLEQGGETIEAARSYERASAHALRRLAFASAAESESRALHLDPAVGQGGSRRLRHLATLLELSGELSQAADVFARALEHALPADSFELKLRRTETLLRCLRIEDGMRSAREAMLELGVRIPESEAHAALSLLYQRVILACRGTRFSRKEERRFSPLELSRIDALLGIAAAVSGASAIGAAELQARGLRLALREREPLRVARALAIDVSMSAMEEAEPHTRSFARLQHARTLAGDDPSLTAWLDVVEGAAHFFDLHPARALPLLDRAEHVLSDHAEIMSHDRWMGKLFRLDTSNLVESFSATEALAQHALEEARLRGDQQLTSIVLLRGVYPLVLARDCDPDAAAQVIDEAMARWPNDRIYIPHFFALQARGLLAQHRALPGALAVFEADTAKLSSALFMRSRVVRTVLEGIRSTLIATEAAATTGSTRRAWLARLRESLRTSARGASGIGRMLSLLCLGTERWLSDRPDQALAQFEDALTLCQERQLHTMGAYARMLSGTILGGEEGKARFSHGRAQLLAEGCRDPDNIVRVFLPGIPGG